ncbi:MAG: YraN family protein [Verrucomicrobiales bacterium]
MASKGGQPLGKGEIGALGEDLAARHLRSQGAKVLYRNFRAPQGGEVDLVCRDGEVLAFIEIKTRTNAEAGAGMRAVDAEKQALILRGGREWLRMLPNRESITFRYDVVEVLLAEGKPPVFHWIKAAFSLPKGHRF